MSQNKFLLFMLFFFLLLACKKEKKQVLPTVDELVAEKLEAFKQERLKECHKNAIIEANRLVDSTLLANAKTKKAFATIKPPIPDKPIKPDPLQPIDSSIVAPILNLTQEEQDSINLLKLDIEEEIPLDSDIDSDTETDSEMEVDINIETDIELDTDTLKTEEIKGDGF